MAEPGDHRRARDLGTVQPRQSARACPGSAEATRAVVGPARSPSSRTRCPGAVYVYQGEELGLADVDLPDEARQDPVFFRTNGEQKGRDAARVPMPVVRRDGPVRVRGERRHVAAHARRLGGRDGRCPGQRPRQHPVAVPHDAPAAARAARAGVRGAGGAGADGDLLVIDRGPGFSCVVNCGTDTADLSVPGAGPRRQRPVGHGRGRQDHPAALHRSLDPGLAARCTSRYSQPVGQSSRHR